MNHVQEQKTTLEKIELNSSNECKIEVIVNEEYNQEDIYLSYNLEKLLDIFFDLKEQSFYSGIFDLDVSSSEFVNLITDNVIYYKLNEPLDEYVEDFDFETS